MPFPTQTFTTIQELFDYINTYIVPNGMAEINGTEHNNVENGLASFIVTYTLNSGLVNIVNGGGIVGLSKPITVFSTPPTAVNWPNNIQNEYYVINATGFDIPIQAGLSYINVFQGAITVFPARTVIHIAKATNGQWIQVNNLGPANSSLPPQTGHGGQALFTTGAAPFWGDLTMQIPPDDPNWVNGTTWQNGFAIDNPSFSSSHFTLFWNEFSRYLLQNQSPPEWQYVNNGFQVLVPDWDVHTWAANMFLTFKGVNS